MVNPLVIIVAVITMVVCFWYYKSKRGHQKANFCGACAAGNDGMKALRGPPGTPYKLDDEPKRVVD